MPSIGTSILRLFGMRSFVQERPRAQEASKDAARRRLQLVLIQDRIGLSQEMLEALKNDLLNTISKYLVIQRDTVEMELSRSGDSVTLVSNIRVNDIRKSPV